MDVSHIIYSLIIGPSFRSSTIRWLKHTTLHLTLEGLDPARGNMFTLNRVKTNPAGFLSQVPKALDEKSIAGVSRQGHCSLPPGFLL